jgi:hypothetical protein
MSRVNAGAHPGLSGQSLTNRWEIRWESCWPESVGFGSRAATFAFRQSRAKRRFFFVTVSWDWHCSRALRGVEKGNGSQRELREGLTLYFLKKVVFREEDFDGRKTNFSGNLERIIEIFMKTDKVENGKEVLKILCTKSLRQFLTIFLY